LATPSFDMSGLVRLESAVAAMVAAQAANPAVFTGGATFTATYGNTPENIGISPTTETTSSIKQRIANLKLAFDRLNL
jgi:hypothetical protein